MNFSLAKINLRRLAALAALLSSGVICRSEEAGPIARSESWAKTNQSVVELLFREQKDIVPWAQELSQTTPVTAPEAMRKLNVLLRAGLWSDAIQTFDQLHAVCPDLDNSSIQSIYHLLCDEFGAWEAAQHLVEVFADNIQELPLESRLLKHFIATGSSVEAIDEWLATRPAGKTGFWMRERLRFNASHARAGQILEKLSAEVRANPANIAGAIEFLDAVQIVGLGPEKRPDLSWFPAIVQPAGAADSQQVALHLQRFGEWASAASFYRAALAVPLSPEEVGQMKANMQTVVLDETIIATFRVRTTEGLSACLLQLGQKEEAQRLMEEAVTLRRKGQLGADLFFAGRTQAITGARVIEKTVLAAEQTSTDDPHYWLERATYYRGRQDAAAEEDAYRKALGLAAAEPRPTRPSKGFDDLRGRVISSLDHFLSTHQRELEAITLLLQELQDSPAESVSSERAANLLAFEHRTRLVPDENACWRWLGDRPVWAHTEQRLLWAILQCVDPARLDLYLNRAEELSVGADPSRNQALGWIMNRMQQARRSIPLLQDAVARLTDEEQRNSTQFTLFESYLDTGDWRQAEAIFPDVSRRLTGSEIPSWQSRIAVFAARDGAKPDALRIWKAVANLNPCFLERLDDLAGAGLSTELRAYYGEFSRRLPSSVAPARALKVIAERESR